MAGGLGQRPAALNLTDPMHPAVLLILFRRADSTRHLVNRLREVKPERLYVAADGPRPQVPGEAESCELCRAVIAEIDWPCEIVRRFSSVNQGCRWGPINAINWFFEHETEGIILEDDILPDPTFFPFCAELLTRYRTNQSVGCICGYNFLPPSASASSYFFSHLSLTWGWATWRDRWQSFGRADKNTARDLSAVDRQTWLSRHDRRDFKRKLREAFAEDHVWDFLWMFHQWCHSQLILLPAHSLTRNIGIGGAATHTHVVTDVLRSQSQPVTFPLRHPPTVEFSRAVDQEIFRELLHTPTLGERVFGVLKSGRPVARLLEIIRRRIRPA